MVSQSVLPNAPFRLEIPEKTTHAALRLHPGFSTRAFDAFPSF